MQTSQRSPKPPLKQSWDVALIAPDRAELCTPWALRGDEGVTAVLAPSRGSPASPLPSGTVAEAEHTPAAAAGQMERPNDGFAGGLGFV